MKIAEIRQIPANELAERLQTEVANYNQLVLNHSITEWVMAVNSMVTDGSYIWGNTVIYDDSVGYTGVQI